MRRVSAFLIPLVAAAIARVILAVPAHATDNWSWDGTVLFHDPSVLYGAIPALGAAGEIAIVQQTLTDGQSIQLPTYSSDGSVADVSEVFWIVSVRQATVDVPPTPDPHVKSTSFGGLKSNYR